MRKLLSTLFCLLATLCSAVEPTSMTVRHGESITVFSLDESIRVTFGTDTPTPPEPPVIIVETDTLHDTVWFEPTCPPLEAITDTLWLHDTTRTGQYDIAEEVSAAYWACKQPWMYNEAITPNVALENTYWTEESMQAFLDARDAVDTLMKHWIEDPHSVTLSQATEIGRQAQIAAGHLTPLPDGPVMLDLTPELNKLARISATWESLNPSNYEDADWTTLQSHMDAFNKDLFEAYDNLGTLTKYDVAALGDRAVMICNLTNSLKRK